MRESVPVDVRVLNLATSVLITVLALSGLCGGLWWIIQHPAFAIRGITVVGDVRHNSASILRDRVVPGLRGNFFTLDLNHARGLFEKVPWVRKAVIQREFPNRIRVTLEEHTPVAFWGKVQNQLVNVQGEVFEIASEPDGVERFPKLLGPAGHSSVLLEHYNALEPVLHEIGVDIEEVELLSRGGWRLVLGNGAVVMLGRGGLDDLKQRLELLVNTLPVVVARYGRTFNDVLVADMRHSGAYALKLKGVATLPENQSLRTSNRRN